ncbi:oligosaccharide flippase family protein [Planococcus shenhongbingii]|uniref:lipopolysaccharide biosynthesis protein n=1 Tax=Planococcus shenhongbingii TaxID=3058398 RepID=UPI002636F403|nr:oligosaccharide flippase family protein [Planococcus sp. N016]WKA57816.1 oligosaccharide flippase family protein [Planococcus sp. N016]
MGIARKFIKTSAVFFLGNTLTKLVSFLLIPLYTAKIAPESFGYYDLSISLINLAVPILFFQIWDGIFRFTFDFEEPLEKYKVISNGLFIHIFGVVVFVAFSFTFQYFFDIKNLYLVTLYGILFSFQYYYNCVARSFSENTLVVLTGLINSFTSISINIFAIVVLGMGIESLYLSFIIGTIIQISILEWKFKLLYHFKIKSLSRSLMKMLLKFSLPISLITVSYWLLSGLTKVTISNKLGLEENGIFSIANRLTTVIILAVNVFQFAWYEMSYNLTNNSRKNEYYNLSINYILKVIFLVGSLFLIILKILFPYLINEDYQEVFPIIPVVFIGVLINSYSSFAGTFFLAEKNSTSLLFPTLFGAFANGVFLIIFIEPYGLMGAAISLTLAFLLTALLITLKINKMYKIYLKFKTLFVGTFMTLLSVLTYYFITDLLILYIGIFLLIFIFFITFKEVIFMIYETFLKKEKIT